MMSIYSMKSISIGVAVAALILSFQNCSAPQEEMTTASSKASKSGSKTPIPQDDLIEGPEVIDPNPGMDPITPPSPDPKVGIPQTPPKNNETAVFQVDTSFGKLTIVCNAYANASADVPMFIRCKGDGTNQLKTAFGTAHTIPSSLRVWGYDLTLNFNYFGTQNNDTDVYSDSSCSQKHDYVVGSGAYLSTSGSFKVPRCKDESKFSTLKHCMDSTQCAALSGTPYGTLYVKNKSVGWTTVEFVYENIRR